MAKTGIFDYILIEASGVAEPLPIAETFTFDDEVDGTPVKDLAMVDTMVTVVDAFNFLKDFKGVDTLEVRKLAGQCQCLQLEVTGNGMILPLRQCIPPCRVTAGCRFQVVHWQPTCTAVAGS